ncbi:MAG: glycosyltransferase family 39 protein [Chloroflexi bacterium]|nr:glycosyltransferase family 39 protein [Chloroflexota bacterium]
MKQSRGWFDARLVIGIILGKLVVMLVILMAYKLMPFAEQNLAVNFIDPGRETPSIQTAYSTWDSQHYLFLSEHGYQAGQLSDIYFPLYPGLIRLATPIFGSSLVAALVVANLASVVGLYFLFRMLGERFGQDVALRSLLLFLAAPTAFYFSLLYSESLFLLLISLFFFFLFRRQLGWASIPAGLLPLSRPTGIVVVVPFAVYYLVEVAGAGREREWWPRLFRREVLWLATPLLGIAAYLTFMYLATGNPLEMAEATKMNISGFSLTAALHPVQLFQQLFQQPLEVHGFNDSMIDRAFFAAFLALLIPLFRRVHPALAFYTLAVGLITIVSGSFVSYSRYVMLGFPLFVVLTLLLDRENLAFLRAPLTYLFVMVQSLFLVMHALNYWVA